MLMSTTLIVAVAGIAAVVAFLAKSRLWRGQVRDLGTVSNQWVAEQRLGHSHDPRR